jgi:TPR repeat protein
MALLEKAAGKGHAYAMHGMGSVHEVRKEYVQAVEWFTKGAEAGLPVAMAGGLLRTSTGPTFLSLLLLRILSGVV